MPILNKSDFKVESKAHEFWRKTVQKGAQAVQYIEEHKEVIIIATPLILAGIGLMKKGIGGVGRFRAMHELRDLKDYRVYDRRLGAYLRLRRPLRNSDWQLITPRMNNGEKLVDILQKMDLLK